MQVTLALGFEYASLQGAWGHCKCRRDNNSDNDDTGSFRNTCRGKSSSSNSNGLNNITIIIQMVVVVVVKNRKMVTMMMMIIQMICRSCEQ